MQELTPPQQTSRTWPDRHIVDEHGAALPFHIGQDYAHDSLRRIVALIAGTQSGKTVYGPWWLDGEISRLGGGDYYAITATYDLFKLKMLPSLLTVFEDKLAIGRYWSGDRIIELQDPTSGTYWAQKSSQPMYARIILRSADSKGGLESGTAKAAWLDEAGQERFDLKAWRATKRRLALARGRILITTTLYELGFLDTEILAVAESGGYTEITEVPGRGEMEITDNPDADMALVQFDSTINPEFPLSEMLEAQEDQSDEEYQAFYRGRRVTSRLMIYDCWDGDINLTPRYKIPADWPRYLGLDFGAVNTAALYFAERPDGTLFVYDKYLAGGKTGEDHATDIVAGEHHFLSVYGGSKSEANWRLEFRSGGLSVREPKVSEVDIGITRVYGQIKKGKLIFFDDLDDSGPGKPIEQMRTYRRKRDKLGQVTDEIENKAAYHFNDCVRYLVASIRTGRATKPKIIALVD